MSTGFRLFDGVGREREANRVPDAFEEQRGDPRDRLDQAPGRRTSLCDTEVEWVLDPLCEQAIRLHHERHVRVLDGDLDVVESHIFEVPNLSQGRANERFWDGRSKLFEKILVERTGVDADPDRHPRVGCGSCDSLDVLFVSDVPRVQPQSCHAGFESRQRQPVLEVDIGDDRNRRPRDDLCETLCCCDVIARDSYDVRACTTQGVHLGQRAVDVGRLGGGHGLNTDRRATTDSHVADHELPGVTP